MQRLCIWLGAVLISSPLSWASQAETFNYNVTHKCHLEYRVNNRKRETIVQRDVDPKIVKALIAELAAGYIYAADGKTKLKVSKVFECVPLTSEFQSVIARDLESKTPY
ncbi:hypothetical protein C2869_19955 [Saccharobesus litoralis]|uniref:Uncharacterized protein n=1 Tax=Saccharobesus litoralis TaxID=2172099 RepID=A0A2S0VWD7_9ALTE|nr:TapY2 family type IVa secretion system protein [Saccharobesus litoralis]AWB68534.1 hypothetical protein C2869_19955 [Saccharobesus litoralis]